MTAAEIHAEALEVMRVSQKVNAALGGEEADHVMSALVSVLAHGLIDLRKRLNGRPDGERIQAWMRQLAADITVLADCPITEIDARFDMMSGDAVPEPQGRPS